VAFVRNTRRGLIDDDWDEVTSDAELVDEVPSESLRRLEDFSHVEIIFSAEQAHDVPPEPWQRRPRGNPQWPDVVIFAQRNKDRPNRLLVSIAAIENVGDRSLRVRGLDDIDGTPVFDIKPVFSWNGPRGEIHVAPRSDEIGTTYF